METKYAFWNNKGGTGKTSLAFQAIARYAEKNPKKRVLAIDVCPQANLSELMLGGLNNNGSERLLAQQGLTPRCSIGGYFQLRLPSPYSPPTFNAHDFITKPNAFNKGISATGMPIFSSKPLIRASGQYTSAASMSVTPYLSAGGSQWIARLKMSEPRQTRRNSHERLSNA